MSSNSRYFIDGELLEKVGDVRIYTLNDSKYMEVGHTNIVASDEDVSTYIWQLGKIPKGDVLIIGLGLGISAGYMSSIPKVDSVVVLEPNKDIIECQEKINKLDFNGLRIINEDVLKYLYETNDNYDFIYLDFYSLINDKTLPMIADVAIAARRALRYNGRIAGRPDPSAPNSFLDLFSGFLMTKK